VFSLPRLIDKGGNLWLVAAKEPQAGLNGLGMTHQLKVWRDGKLGMTLYSLPKD
jgi:hypothetical protein